MSLYLMPSSIQKKLEMMRNKFFIGGVEGERKITWVKWEKCLSSRELGSLGIGSIHALNLGLIFKWIWRFLCHKNDLWARVISNIYGIKGGINEDRSIQSSWGIILSSIRKLKLKGLDVLSMCKRKLGNGILTSFWDDDWCGIGPLKILFPRIYLLDLDKGCNVANRLPLSDWSSILRRHPRGGIEMSQFSDMLSTIKDFQTSDQDDTWVWTGNGSFIGFSVAFIVFELNSKLFLLSHPLIWKGIDMDSVLCPIYWEVDIPICSNFHGVVDTWNRFSPSLVSKLNVLVEESACQRGVSDYLRLLGVYKASGFTHIKRYRRAGMATKAMYLFESNQSLFSTTSTTKNVRVRSFTVRCSTGVASTGSVATGTLYNYQHSYWNEFILFP
ncbi:hypothetical protein Tco_0762004 [Tanacetum coccineum]